MKNSLIGRVCAGLVIGIGLFGHSSATTLLYGGYSVSALRSQVCSAQGEGSGSLTGLSGDCSETIDSGSFLVAGSGQASFSTLRASAGVGLSSVRSATLKQSGSFLARADGSAEYLDTLVIDVAGRTGEVVKLVFETALNGAMGASADIDRVYAQADASLRVDVNGERVIVSRNAKSDGIPAFNDFNPGEVQIQLGSPFVVNARLLTTARLDARGSFLSYTGDAFAHFGNSGGITSFLLFEAGEGGAPITGWQLSSESGEFGFYVVPLPASGWLLLSALVATGALRRRRQVDV